MAAVAVAVAVAAVADSSGRLGSRACDGPLVPNPPTPAVAAAVSVVGRSAAAAWCSSYPSSPSQSAAPGRCSVQS